ncbi:MAG: phosphoribosylformylglycinamidine cyclo-ligase [bacterium]|nr:phosphoribosylformylglycinamidine cyclo-ligase [bacterium]
MKYADSGVNIDAATRALARSRDHVRSTWDARVRNEIGAFGGLFQPAPGEPLMVASVDGVGTKVMVAVQAGRYDTVGQDLVNHCVDDILVQGAEPLFFLDYFATAKLDEAVLPEVLAGFAKACRENGCALLGGETAEMPGVYRDGEFDLAGTIVGRVLPEHVIDGSAMRAGDRVWGLPSTGLHTNGYSLARKVIFERAGLAVTDTPPELGGATVADAHMWTRRPGSRCRCSGSSRSTAGWPTRRCTACSTWASAWSWSRRPDATWPPCPAAMRASSAKSALESNASRCPGEEQRVAVVMSRNRWG